MIGLIIWYFLMPNKYSVENECKQIGLLCPNIVTKQIKLETGHFKSKNCKVRNNLTGMRHKSNITKDNPMGYFIYDHWTESIKHYKENISVRHRIGESYYDFLIRMGYAEDKSYINKLKSM